MFAKEDRPLVLNSLFQNKPLPAAYPTVWYERWLAICATSLIAAVLANVGLLGVIVLALIPVVAFFALMSLSSSSDTHQNPRTWFNAYISQRALADSFARNWTSNDLISLKEYSESVKLRREQSGRNGPIEEVEIEFQYLTDLIDDVELKLAMR